MESTAADRRTTEDSGYAMVSAVLITGALLVSGVAAIQMARTELHATADHVASQKAFYVADTGVQYALAQLNNDAASANSSTAYAYATTSPQSFGPGSFQVTIAQDPNHATDPRWKRIVSTGSVQNMSSVIAAQAFLQPPTASNLCTLLLASDNGRARMFGIAAVGGLSSTTFFNGDIFTNPGNDVYFSMLASLGTDAYGTVYAGRDFHSSTLLNADLFHVPMLHASLLRAGSYVIDLPETALVHTHPLGAPSLEGFHFNNQNNAGAGHGVASTITARRLPRPDYESLKRLKNTVIVNSSNVPAGTSWDSTTNTWVASGPLIFGSFAANPNVNYYVEGNAQISSLQLAGGSSVQLVARGWMTVQTLGLVTLGSVCTSGNKMVGPASAGASVCVVADANSIQKLHLYAEEDLVIGYSTIDIAANVFSSGRFLNATEQIYLTAGVSTVVGLGTTVVNAGGSTNLLARSEKGSVWALVSAVTAGSNTNLNVCAEKDATVAFAATVASAVGTYTPS